MRWRRIAFWTGLAVLSAVVLLLSWLWTADLGVFKPQIERIVTEQTGREFAIDGKFHVDLAATSVVVAENVRFANASWADEPHMVSVGRVELRVDTWSLVRPPVQVMLVEIEDAEILLTEREDGAANWSLPIESDATADESEDGFSLLDLLVDQVDIDRVRVVYTDPARSGPLELDVASLRQHRRDDDFHEIVLDSTLNGKVLSLNGEAGTWGALVSGKDIRFDATLVLDTLRLTANGRLDDLMDMRRPTVAFAATGPDIDDVSRVLGIGDEGDGDIDLVGTLAAEGDAPLELRVIGNLGATEVDVRGVFSDLQNFDTVDFAVRANGPDLGRLLRIAGVHNVREAPFMIDIDATRDGNGLVVDHAKMLFGEGQFDATANLPHFPSVDDATVRLKIFGPDIERFRYIFNLPGAATGAFEGNFELDVAPDGVELVQLSLETSIGKLTAGGSLGEAPSYVGSKLSFDLHANSLATTAGIYGIEDLPDRPIAIAGSVELLDEAVRLSGPVAAKLDETELTVTGDVMLADAAVGTDVVFAVSGPDLADSIGAFVEIAQVPYEPFEIGGRLQVQDRALRFRDVAGEVGTTGVEISGLLALASSLASQFDFQLSGPAFEEATAQLDVEVVPGAFDLNGRVTMNSDSVELEDVLLSREHGSLGIDLELGLPASRRSVDFAVKGRGRDVRVLLASLDRFDAKAVPFTLDMRGRLRGTNLDIDEYEFAIADAVMLAQGEIDLAENASSTNLRFSGNVPSLATIGTFDEREFSDQSLAWEGQVIGGSGRLHLDDFQVVLGGSDVFGDVIYEAGEVPELTLSLTSDALVYKPLLEPVEVVDYEPEPVFDDGKLIPDLPIPFDAMAKLNADVDIEVKRLQRGSLLLGNLSFRATLVNGALSIFDTGFNARSGRMDMRASIKPADGIGSANFELVARDFALGMTELNQDLASRGSFDINLASTGNDLRSLAGNIDGVLFVDIRGGRIGHNRFVQALYGDLLDEIVSAINPFYKRDPYTTFECIVLPVAIDNGVVHGEPNSFIATDKVRMTLKSKINLATEKIDVNVRTTPRKTLSISAGELVNPFVKVVGTLARPALAVDETGVLITGGAAVATGGISVLARAAWDRLGGARDKCGATGERGREVLAERFPDLEIRETVADFASAEMPATATDTIVNDVAETESPPK